MAVSEALLEKAGEGGLQLSREISPGIPLGGIPGDRLRTINESFF